MVTYDFQTQLKKSEQASHEPFWDAVYRKAFPNIVNHMPCPGDTLSQRMGIDRLIMLANGRTITVDEKKRDASYPDILLEYLSNSKTQAPGWMEKDLVIDYLAYAFMPTRKVYLFDWLMLRRAWGRYKADWLKAADDPKNKEYRRITAKNNGYLTLSVAVPIKVVQQAVQTASIIQLSPQEWQTAAVIGKAA